MKRLISDCLCIKLAFCLGVLLTQSCIQLNVTGAQELAPRTVDQTANNDLITAKVRSAFAGKEEFGVPIVPSEPIEPNRASKPTDASKPVRDIRTESPIKKRRIYYHKASKRFQSKQPIAEQRKLPAAPQQDAQSKAVPSLLQRDSVYGNVHTPLPPTFEGEILLSQNEMTRVAQLRNESQFAPLPADVNDPSSVVLASLPQEIDSQRLPDGNLGENVLPWQANQGRSSALDPDKALEKSNDSKLERLELLDRLDEPEVEGRLESVMPERDSDTSQPSRYYDQPNSIAAIDLSIAVDERTPDDEPIHSGSQEEYLTWIAPKSFSWAAPNFNHRNLFFEEPLLERHGYSVNQDLQPVISGAIFFAKGFVLPLDYVKGYHRHCDNPLGWGTPGSYSMANCKRCACTPRLDQACQCNR